MLDRRRGHVILMPELNMQACKTAIHGSDVATRLRGDPRWILLRSFNRHKSHDNGRP